MSEIQQAVRALRDRLGRPPWLSAIGIGEEDGQPVIVLYLTSAERPRLPWLGDEWQGFKVTSYEFGSFVPLGGWTE